MYWDSTPTVALSADLEVANYPGGDRRLGPPTAYLRGRWEDRDWRNVPGPFYGARTDSCWMGRTVAPDHVVYEDEYGSEIVFRQPRNPDEVRLVLTAAWNDPFCAYAADGDKHWTLDLVRRWWAGRDRLLAWTDDVQRRWAGSERSDERDNASGLHVYAQYIGNGLEADLRAYGFWLDNAGRRWSTSLCQRLASSRFDQAKSCAMDLGGLRTVVICREANVAARLGPAAQRIRAVRGFVIGITRTCHTEVT